MGKNALIVLVLACTIFVSNGCVVPERDTNFDDLALRSDVVIEAESTLENLPERKRYDATFRVTNIFSSKTGSLKVGDTFTAGKFGDPPACVRPKFGKKFIMFLTPSASPKKFSLRYNPVGSSGRNLKFFEQVISGTYGGETILRSGCKQLRKPDHGVIKCSKNKIRCVISCEKGYIMESGTKFKACQPKTGLWYPFKQISCIPDPDIATTTTAQSDSTTTEVTPASTIQMSTIIKLKQATPRQPRRPSRGGARGRTSGRGRPTRGGNTGKPRGPAGGRNTNAPGKNKKKAPRRRNPNLKGAAARRALARKMKQKTSTLSATKSTPTTISPRRSTTEQTPPPRTSARSVLASSSKAPISAAATDKSETTTVKLPTTTTESVTTTKKRTPKSTTVKTTKATPTTIKRRAPTRKTPKPVTPRKPLSSRRTPTRKPPVTRKARTGTRKPPAILKRNPPTKRKGGAGGGRGRGRGGAKGPTRKPTTIAATKSTTTEVSSTEEETSTPNTTSTTTTTTTKPTTTTPKTRPTMPTYRPLQPITRRAFAFPPRGPATPGAVRDSPTRKPTMRRPAPRPSRKTTTTARTKPALPVYRPLRPLANRPIYPRPVPATLKPQSVAVLKKVPNKPVLGEELDNVDDKFAVAKDGDEWTGEDGLTYMPELAVNKTVFGCPRYESNLTVFSFWPGGFNAMVNFSRLTKPIMNGWIVRVHFESAIKDIETHVVNFYVGTEDKTIVTFTPKPYMAILYNNQDLTIAFVARLEVNDATPPRGKGSLMGRCLDEELDGKVVGNMFQGHKVVTSYGPDSQPQEVPVAPTRAPTTQAKTQRTTTEQTPPPRRPASRGRGTARGAARPKSTTNRGGRNNNRNSRARPRANNRLGRPRSAFNPQDPENSWPQNRCLTESANGSPPVGGLTVPDWTKSTVKNPAYDYNEILHKSLLFFAAQRSGKLPKSSPIPWRGNSALKDGCSAGLDLQGGLYNGGGHEKSTVAIAFTTTMLAWGAIDYKAGYIAAGEYDDVIKLVKTNARYLIRCHSDEDELVVQVGKHDTSGTSWSRPEDISADGRVVYKINPAKPGQDAAAEVAAALAATSFLFKTTDATFSKECLLHAKQLYTFARKNPGQYSKIVPEDVNNYYTTSSTIDDLAWAMTWLGRATGSEAYFKMAQNMYSKLTKNTQAAFYWDDKANALSVLLAKLTKNKEFKIQARKVILNLRKNAPKTPSGQVWLSDKGPNMHTANAAFLGLQTATLFKGTPFASTAASFAEEQLHLLLGDSGRSYVVGFGKQSPKRPHHMASSCMDYPAKCDSSVLRKSADNAHTLYGALVGGPDKSGLYQDLLTEQVYNEVSIDFNAGFQSAIAGLREMQIPGKSLISKAPNSIRREGQPVRKNNG